MYEYKIIVKKVVDGDTLDADIDLGFNTLVRRRLRVNGIDTPESRTKDLKEKEMGLKAKKLVADAVKNAETVIVKSYGEDKYGRVLVDLFCDGENIAEKLITEGLAWKYDGKTKDKDLSKLSNLTD
jgi:micrococcal nuclease